MTRGMVSNVMFILVITVSVFAITGALLKRGERRERQSAAPVHFITEQDDAWVPRVAGSTATPVVTGQCGQWDGRSWHRIMCPVVEK